MLTFLDGPLQGRTLMARRAPFFVRATLSGGTQADVLDMLDDTPRHAEEVHVYHLDNRPSVVFVRAGKPSQGGRFETGTYRLSPVQPADAVARDNKEWCIWCVEQWEAWGKAQWGLATRKTS